MDASCLSLKTHIAVTDGDRNSLWVYCYSVGGPICNNSLYAFSVNYRQEYNGARTLREIRIGIRTDCGIRVLSYATPEEMLENAPAIIFKGEICNTKIAHDPSVAHIAELAHCRVDCPDLLLDVQDLVNSVYAPESTYVFK